MVGRRRSMAAGSVLVAATMLLTAAPVVAGTATVPDAAGDSGEGVDLLRLLVRHAEPSAPRRLAMRVRHAGLPGFDTRTFTTVTFWIDTDRADRGPEFVADVVPNTGGLQLHSVKGWRRGGDTAVPCPTLRARADVFTDKPVSLKVPRTCLGEPRGARVAVLGVGETPRGEVVGRDWVGGRRHWSPWVRP